LIFVGRILHILQKLYNFLNKIIQNLNENLVAINKYVTYHQEQLKYTSQIDSAHELAVLTFRGEK